MVEARDSNDALRDSISQAVQAIPEVKMGMEEELIQAPQVEFRDIQNDYVAKGKVILDRRPLFDE